MPCFDPIPAYYVESNYGGRVKKSLYFNSIERPNMQVPCGRCIGCRMDKKREWATRCMHEAALYEHNTFITLTYSDENLPKGGTLNHRHYQLFMKRLRKKLGGKKIRYFMCGEYGPTTNRPHYHAILFNIHFDDKKFWKFNQKGDPIFTSVLLSNTWRLGHSSLGAVTPRSASYVAGYVQKKMNGEEAQKKYGDRYPEYGRMSNRPGIGKDWLIKHADDVYPGDFVLFDGKKVRVPKYYDTLLGREEPELLQAIKEERIKNNTEKAYEGEKSSERLEVKRKVAEARQKLNQREEL